MRADRWLSIRHERRYGSPRREIPAPEGRSIDQRSRRSRSANRPLRIDATEDLCRRH